MKLSNRRWLRGLLLGIVYTLGVMGIVASGGGGGGSDDDEPPTTVGSKAIDGGGVKGPLANAIVTVYAFDPTQPGFRGAVIATATTDASAAIVGLSIPGSATPPFVMEFTSDVGTTDITTGMAPVIDTMRTVVTQGMLDSGAQIYATPLSTMGVDIAIANSGPATTGAQFEAALADAAIQVVSTLGFGMPGDIDIYLTPPLVNNDTDTADEQAAVAAYRSSVEALTAVVFAIDQQSSGDANTALLELSMDLADGAIDGMVGGNPSSVFSSTALDVLAQDPSMLVIPNTAPPRTIADVQGILIAETATTGTTTTTTALGDGTITTTTAPAATNADSDGDGTPNSRDAFPNNPGETADSDGDGLGDNADPDDDNNGIDDDDEGTDPAPTASDADGDGFDDGVDNCPANFNPGQTNTDGMPDGGNACDADDDDDGTPDTSDAFPLNPAEQRDADGDGIGDVADTDDDNDGLGDAAEDAAGASIDHDNDLVPNREDIDSDNDGALDKVDFDPYNDAITRNQAPLVADSNLTTDEDVAVAVTLDVSDDGVAAGALTFDINGPANGGLSGTAPNLIYTPNAEFSGGDNLTFTATDGAGKTSAIATVSITVEPVNDDPVIDQAGPLAVTMDEDGVPTAFAAPTITASDIDGDTLTWSGSSASNGTATVSGTGSSPTINYSPNADYSGPDSFNVIVSDGNGGSDSITINVNVDPINDDPVIAQTGPLVVNMDEDGDPTAFVAPTITATDVEGDTLTWSGSSASNGTATVSGTGSSPTINYSPNADYSGTDSFNVIVSDGNGGSDSITIDVNVGGENDDPVIAQTGPLVVDMDEDGAPTAFAAPTITASDIDGDTLTWSGSSASNGTATVSGTGSSPTINYSPNADYNGPDSFNVIVSDGNGGSDSITINVNVDPINDDPVIAQTGPLTVEMNENGTPNPFVAPTITASDVDGDTLNWSGGAASNGVASVSGSGASPTVTYSPNTDFTGSDSFDVTVSDGNGGSATITIDVTVVPTPTSGAVWDQFDWDDGSTWQ